MIRPTRLALRDHDGRVGVATDLGYMPESGKLPLRGADPDDSQANHDLEC